jgi:hypothetical protein
MAINFTDSPANGATITQGNSTFTYNSTYGVWDRSIAASAISVYATLANLPLSDVSDDTIAKVLDTDKLYIWDGSGWYYLPPTNTNPTITTASSATYELATDGTPTVITLEANDPEGIPITWSYAVTAGSLASAATVSQADNVFTITPSTTEADAGEFSLTFTASDGVNIATSASEFSLAFSRDWSAGAQQAKLLASDAEAGDTFGASVSLSDDGNTVIVGADGEATGGSGAGAAYIFTRSGTTWSQQAKLMASDAEAGDDFGDAVSISGDGNTVIVAADGEDTGGSGAGAAYIFTRSGTTWSQQAKLMASDKQSGDNFGKAVSISNNGNTVIVSANGEDTLYTNAGSAYIFTRSGTTWTQEAKIQASNAANGVGFGDSVSISDDGNTSLVGASGEDTGGLNVGSVYIYTRSGTTWSQEAMIQASDKQSGDSFGKYVSISGDGNTVIVAAEGEDTGADNAGAAYIFTRSGTTWSQQAKIQASDAEAGDNFGKPSISGDGNTVIVGAIREDTIDTDAGAAYLFTRSGTTWSQEAKIQASDATLQDRFGNSVSISGDGNTAIAGAYTEDTTGDNNAGAAYIFVAG